jgi:Fe-S oxidoreductase
MKTHNPLKVVNDLMGQKVELNDRCCGESGTFAITRPDISTQVRFRKQQEMEAGAERLRKVGAGDTATQPVKILTSCPSCLQGLARYRDDANVEADYIVVEMAKAILGPNWMQDYLQAANEGGVERVLL